MRLDAWLVQHGFFDSRQRAQGAVKAGQVRVNGAPALKPAAEISADSRVEVGSDPLRYVSRGGLKLEKAIREFQLDFTGKTVLDAGASTGGFTDCALQHGAAQVFAVDVGSGQLADGLRHHPQVRFYENQDVRLLTTDFFEGKKPDFILADLSFISLTHVLPAFAQILGPGGLVVLLVKPQFEMENRLSLKGGIVKDPAMHQAALRRVLDCAAQLGFASIGQTETDVEDLQKKNKEFLMLLRWTGA